MGKGGGAKEFNPLIRNIKDQTNSLEELRNKTVAVDLSPVMYQGIHSAEGGDWFHVCPEVPVYGITETLKKLVNCFDFYNIKMIAVFDGMRHPGKEAVDNSRQKAKDVAICKS